MLKSIVVSSVALEGAFSRKSFYDVKKNKSRHLISSGHKLNITDIFVKTSLITSLTDFYITKLTNKQKLLNKTSKLNIFGVGKLQHDDVIMSIHSHIYIYYYAAMVKKDEPKLEAKIMWLASE